MIIWQQIKSNEKKAKNNLVKESKQTRISSNCIHSSFPSSQKRERKKLKQSINEKVTASWKEEIDVAESDMPSSSSWKRVVNIDSGFSQQSRYARKWPEASGGKPVPAGT